MSGYELAERLSNLGMAQRAPIVLLSSAGEQLGAARREALGIARYLTKPVKQSSLLETIEYVVSRSANSKTDPVEASAPPGRPAPMQILVAEDNVVNQRFIAKLLERAGHSVRLVENGRQAVEAYCQASYDLILMDVQMPEVDGFEAASMIRSKEGHQGGRIPIVALTAHAMSGDREKCLNSGMDAYLSKPVRANELFELLESFQSPATRRA
jgi:CheY-like chemotaxis protein